MKEISVTYLLDDKQAERLEGLAEKYNDAGMEMSAERVFCMMMQAGSSLEIDDKLSINEQTAPLYIKKYLKNKGKVNQCQSSLERS